MLETVVGLLSRWVHISSVVVLLGGVLYARFVLGPATAALAAEGRRAMAEQLAARYRPWLFAALAGLVASGLYNLFTKPKLPAGYHAWFGVKMLLAMHIIAVSVLLCKPGVDEAKRARWMTGIAGSGLAVLLLSAWLRQLWQNP